LAETVGKNRPSSVFILRIRWRLLAPDLHDAGCGDRGDEPVQRPEGAGTSRAVIEREVQAVEERHVL
jgi:hypothetical protein